MYNTNFNSSYNSFKSSSFSYFKLYSSDKLSSNPISIKILDICNYDYMDFIKKSNVIGLGLGYKYTKNTNTNELAICVFVTKKLPKCLLNPKDIVPPFYKNIKTDVFETGVFEALSLTDRIRPVPGGYGISPSLVFGTGTMGCLVKDDLNTYILSCNHVMIQTQIPIGTPILQPSPPHQGSYPQDEIASVSRYIPIHYAKSKSDPNPPENFVDCAIAQVDNLSLVSPLIAKYGKIFNPSYIWLGDDCAKVGSTTEYSSGRIQWIGGTSYIQYNTIKGPMWALFKAVTYSGGFILTLSGDSGSILFNPFNSLSQGLVFAGNNGYLCMSNPMTIVLNSLKVSLV